MDINYGNLWAGISAIYPIILFFVVGWIQACQHKKINKLTIIEKEDNENKKKQAYMILEQIDNQSVRLINKGLAPAYNVRFDYNEDELYFRISKGLFPYPKIIPEQYIELHLISEDAKNIHQPITITWDDDFGKNRKTEEIINLNY